MNDMGGLAFEDLNVGDVWRSESREILASDLIEFAELTGDRDPLHTDADFAASTPFGEPIAHGLLGLSFMAGLSSNCPRVQTIAFVSIQDWQFLKPIFVHDKIHVETKVCEVIDHGRRHGKVVWQRQVVNQNGQVVQQGNLTTLVTRRNVSTRRIDGPQKATELPHLDSESNVARDHSRQ
jgi:3-hydroxybutyryl-CoA dehydratase